VEKTTNRTIVDDIINIHIDEMFNAIANEFNLDHGDIFPLEVVQLDKIKQELGDLMVPVIRDNMF